MNENYYYEHEPKVPYGFDEQYNEEQQILLEDEYVEEVTQITDNYNFSQENIQGFTQILIGGVMITVASSILIFMFKCWLFSKIFKKVNK